MKPYEICEILKSKIGSKFDEDNIKHTIDWYQEREQKEQELIVEYDYEDLILDEVYGWCFSCKIYRNYNGSDVFEVYISNLGIIADIYNLSLTARVHPSS